jgi:1,2-diacylglycerol 3-beta-glucosyltransferase
MHAALDLLLVLVGLPVLAAAAYLFLMALLSGPLPAPGLASTRLKFDIVIPAHNEEAGIARTVENLSRVDWPAAQRRLLVVADNCADGTAARAREAGATVLERKDEQRRGKGYALEHAFHRSLEEGFADAVVVVDADTVASENLLRAFAARLEAGAHAIQAHYGVLNPRASWRTRLMTIALALFHKVRSQARERLRLSCGLRGNGMCFSRAVLREVPHQAFSIVEDLEYGIRLGQAGHRVWYAAEAEVLGEMVSTEKASRSQRRRWEDGRAALRRQSGRALLAEALRKRDLVRFDLAADLIVPPLSTVAMGVMGLGAAAAAASWWRGAPALSLWAAAAGALFLVVYVLRGWAMSGLGARGLLDLLGAPAYVAWKVWLKLRRSGDPKGEWVRTAREGQGPERR